MKKISRLFAVVSLMILKQIECSPVGRIIEGDVSDVKTKFLIQPPQATEHRQADSSNTALLLKSTNFVPSYKSKYSRGYNSDVDFPYPLFSGTSESNVKFAYPWLDFIKEDADNGIQNNNNQDTSDDFKDDNKQAKYEVHEDREDLDVPTYVEQNDRYHFGFYPRPDRHGYQNKHGFGFHHHNHGFGCFPIGNRRRPRPPLPPTTIATPVTAVPSIDPRASTLAGIISSVAPSIDIRMGRNDQADRIIFPE